MEVYPCQRNRATVAPSLQGLELEDALEMGKRPETFTRKKRLDTATEADLTDIEREHFVGQEHRDGRGKPYWIARRVELNDLSSPQLVEYVEKKLLENGVRGKVIPPAGDLPELAEAKYEALSAAWVNRAVAEIISADEIRREIAEEFMEKFGLSEAREYIEEGFEDDDTLSWREALEEKLKAIREEHADAFRAAVEKKLRERLG